jgi:DNA polymerase-4
MPRSVLFADPPAFCVAVERVVAPRLRSRPVAVAPAAGDRAALLAVSAEAREAGVVRGMPVRLARRHCPDLVLLPPNPELYARASRALHEILRAYAPVVEPCGWGHAFLDLSGTERLLGPAADVALRLAREVASRLRLPLAVGAASNKLVSQVAAAVLKDRGGHELLVPPGEEPAFLAPHHLALLPGLPDPVRARLDEYHLGLIGEVAAIPERALCAVFGGRGRALHAATHGIDPRPVLPPERRAELQVSHTLATDTNDLAVLHPLLRALAERLGRRLRRQRLAAARLVVEVSWADHTSARRSAVLAGPATLDAELAAGARRAFALACTKRLAVRAVSLGADHLVEADAQLDLWEALEAAGVELRSAAAPPPPPSRTLAAVPPVRAATEHERPPALQAAVDRIRTRYGVRGVRAAGGGMERVGA